MDAKALDSLTPREREVLRLAFTVNDQAELAHQLGSPLGTVKVHLKRARQKLGTSSTALAARAFAEHERRTTSSGTPPGEVATALPAPVIPTPSPHLSGTERGVNAVHEERAVFEAFEVDTPCPSPDLVGGRRHDLTYRLLAIAGLAVLIGLLILLVLPLSDAAQRLGDIINHNPRH